MAIKDSNITIMVKDMDRSISFYQSIGLTSKGRWGDYAQVTAPGITIGLHIAHDTTASDNSNQISIGFTTDNFEEEKTNLANLSVNIQERSERGGQFIHFTDPDGVALYFIKPNW